MGRNAAGCGVSKHNHDRVAIVGGGPIGLTAAYLLAAKNIPVTVFEREERVLPDYRASTFHPGTMDLFEGTGISEAFLEMGIQCPTVQYRSWSDGKIAEHNTQEAEPFIWKAKPKNIIAAVNRRFQKLESIH